MAAIWKNGVLQWGSTDVRLSHFMAEDSAGTSPGNGLAGIAHTAVTASYRREGAAAQSVTVIDGTSVTTAHADGGWAEEGNGKYDMCWPDAAFATGASWVELTLVVSGCLTVCQPIPLGDGEIDLVDAPNSTAVAALQSGLSTHDPAAVVTALQAVADSFKATGFSTHSAADVRDLLLAVAGSFKADVSALATAAALSTVASNVSAILTDTGTTLPATLVEIVSYIDTEIAAIKARTDLLPADPATETTLAALDTLLDAIKAVTDNLPDGGALDALASILVVLGTPAGASLAADIAGISAGSGIAMGDSVPDPGTANTVGRALRQIIANADVPTSTRAESVGAGSGAYTITVTVDDGTNPLENATVRFVEGVTAKVLTTDVAGQVAMPADAATWSVRVTKPGYNGLVTTLAVSADAAVSYSLSAVAIAAPADPAEATVVADTRSLLGAVVEGIVFTFELSGGATAWGATILDRTSKTMTTDASGRATESLPRTDAMTPSGRQWLVTCQELGWNQKPFTLAAATLNLATLIA